MSPSLATLSWAISLRYWPSGSILQTAPSEFCSAEIGDGPVPPFPCCSRGPLWVKNGHSEDKQRRPLYPSKRTSTDRIQIRLVPITEIEQRIVSLIRKRTQRPRCSWQDARFKAHLTKPCFKPCEDKAAAEHRSKPCIHREPQGPVAAW